MTRAGVLWKPRPIDATSVGSIAARWWAESCCESSIAMLEGEMHAKKADR
jgi:hypothetical protein